MGWSHGGSSSPYVVHVGLLDAAISISHSCNHARSIVDGTVQMRCEEASGGHHSGPLPAASRFQKPWPSTQSEGHGCTRVF
jgi:hypothetical protein